MRVAALLLGAGRGRRLAQETPKAFALLERRTLLAWVVDAVDSCPEVEGFVVAVPPGWEAAARSGASSSSKLLGVVTGGVTRQASVRAALKIVPERFDTIVCHDVARPRATPELFAKVLAALGRADGAVPGVPAPDTVKRVADGLVTETLDRDGLMLIQTPQAFHRLALEDAHLAAKAEGEVATDDAALLERAGFQVAVVPGDPVNRKVTVPEDLDPDG
jgi:2-C-methyl-D-erythritol 4-phosphate cytidylyltransferase